MGLTKQNTAASASPERISVGELRVTTRFYPHASRPKMPCCRCAKGWSRSRHLTLTVLRITGEASLCALSMPRLQPLVFLIQFLFQVLNHDEQESGKFIQNRHKTKQMNKQKKLNGKTNLDIKTTRGKWALRKAESSLRGGRPRPKQATCCESKQTRAWAAFVKSYIPDPPFSVFLELFHFSKVLKP